MKKLLVATLIMWAAPHAAESQGLREVPQRFAHIQPIGLLIGLGTAGVEFSVRRTTTVEVGGLGVYSEKDGIKIFGGGAGLGVRQYFGEGEAAGMVVGGRVDGVWLQGDNSGATRRFLSTGPLSSRRGHLYLGMGLLVGFRWVSTNGWFAEPMVSYEYFAGPRPLVPGSRDLQEELGLSAGIAFGVAW